MKMSYTETAALFDEIKVLAKKYNVSIILPQATTQDELISKEDQQKSIEIVRRADFVISVLRKEKANEDELY